MSRRVGQQAGSSAGTASAAAPPLSLEAFCFPCCCCCALPPICFAYQQLLPGKARQGAAAWADACGQCVRGILSSADRGCASDPASCDSPTNTHGPRSQLRMQEAWDSCPQPAAARGGGSRRRTLAPRAAVPALAPGVMARRWGPAPRSLLSVGCLHNSSAWAPFHPSRLLSSACLLLALFPSLPACVCLLPPW